MRALDDAPPIDFATRGPAVDVGVRLAAVVLAADTRGAAAGGAPEPRLLATAS